MWSKATSLLRRRLACDSAAPRLARAEVQSVALSDAARMDATLVVSELVTNAVRHSGCADEDEIELEIVRTPEGVVISVRDVGYSPTEPAVGQGGLVSGGHGLALVEALCARWGTDRADGRRVWAQLAC